MGVEIRVSSVDVETKTDHHHVHTNNGSTTTFVAKSRLMVRIEGEVVGDPLAHVELMNMRGTGFAYLTEDPSSVRIRTEAEVEEERSHRLYAEREARDHLDQLHHLQTQLTEQRNRADGLERELTSLKMLNGVKDTW